jgi:hypothetical protein
MQFGICSLSIIPIRKEPSHRSELISQLLFGEVFTVTKEQGEWLFVVCAYDGYEGWISTAQFTSINSKDFESHLASPHGISVDIVGSSSSGNQSIAVVAGSTLPFFDGLNLRLGKDKFIFNHQAIIPENNKQAGFIEKISLRYLHAPYLWGGRSPFGIDCSGFSQIIFKFLGITLKRDAYQQAESGTTVNFIEESVTGDLAFFNNEEGKITHVGLILKDNQIIHASGKVRIDKLDHFGIFNQHTKKYSHQLKIIKRVI